jgi:hypothetical protein
MNGWLIAYNWRGLGLEYWNYVAREWTSRKSPDCTYSSRASARRAIRRLYQRALDEDEVDWRPAFSIVRWEDSKEEP